MALYTCPAYLSQNSDSAFDATHSPGRITRVSPGSSACMRSTLRKESKRWLAVEQENERRRLRAKYCATGVTAKRRKRRRQARFRSAQAAASGGRGSDRGVALPMLSSPHVTPSDAFRRARSDVRGRHPQKRTPAQVAAGRRR